MPSLDDSSCPQCGCRDAHKRAVALSPKLTGGNALFWLFGGVIFSTAWSLARPKRYMCNACGHFFTTLTRASQLWLLVLVGLIALFIYGLWLELHPEE